MLKRALLAVTCFAMLFLASGARATEWDRKTTITFNQPVELLGIVLPAGTYVFKLMDVGGTRDLVQVFNAEQNHVFTTIIAIPDLTLKPYDDTHIGFEERPAGTPKAIHDWFYPGNPGGLEFAYR